MWLIDSIAIVLFLIGVFVYEVAERKIFSLLYVGTVLAAGWFFFGPFKDFVLGAGWKTILLHWIPIYLGVGVGVALIKWIQHNLTVASNIREVKEELTKLDITKLATDQKKSDIEKQQENTRLPARRPYGSVFSEPEVVVSEPPAPVVATQEEIDVFRRKRFINMWNEKVEHEEADLESIVVISINDEQWKNPEIVTELLTPRAKKHIETISFWILEWPFVVVSTIIGDLLIKFTKHVAKLFDRLFTGLSKALIRHASKGI